MPSYTATINSTWSLGDAFEYMSDFSNAAGWDPGVVAATRVDQGDVRLGSAFDLTVTFAGRELVLRYRVDAIEIPKQVVFVASTSRLVSTDTLTFENRDGGCRMTYHADLHFKGAAALANPLLALGFRRIGDRAAASLQRVLASS